MGESSAHGGPETRSSTVACHSFTRSRKTSSEGKTFRKRSKALTTLAAFGLIGGAIAGTAGASAPPDTGAGGGEAAPGAGIGRGSDSGIEGADFSGTTVTVFGPENATTDVGAINAALDEFGEANNIDITFTGDADWEANINTQVEGGNPPNIGIFPQPGKLADFVKDGAVKPLPDRGVRRRQGELGRRLLPLRRGRREALRGPGQDRPQVARLVQAGRLRGRRVRPCRRRSTSSRPSSRR